MDTRISVIITCINEQQELEATIRSIRDTAGDKPEIVVVDDCSSTRLSLPAGLGAVLLHNANRCGVGPSRDLGAIAATGSHILITDSHMRFTPGWYDAAIERIADKPRTVHCGVCLGLDSKNMDVNHPNGSYHGATFNFFGPDKSKPGHNQVLEGVWLPEQPGDDYEIPCLMGATYFWPRRFFCNLAPLRFLRSWGVDEQIMSLKCWLAGGDIRMMKTVRIGHKFRLKNEKLPFTIKTPHLIYNKLLCILTLIPEPYASALISRFTKNLDFNTASQLIRDDWHIIAREQERNKRMLADCNGPGFEWLLSKFSLPCPR